MDWKIVIMEWKTFWDEFPSRFQETDFLRQVGKTVSGQPISPGQFAAIVSDIENALHPGFDDRILDLCCGNGILTAQVARACASVVGVDYSAPLIDIARKHNQPPNVAYYCMSVLDPAMRTVATEPFTKIYMYEALQHFRKQDLPELLRLMVDTSIPNVVILLAGIPDMDRIWKFYDTEERRAEYRRRVSEGTEAIGTWWLQTDLQEAARQCGFDCRFLPQNPVLHTAHYRFDACLFKHPD